MEHFKKKKKMEVFILAVAVTAAFHSATGLQCFSLDEDNLCDDASDGQVVECTGVNPGCSISETYAFIGVGAVKTCSKGCLDDLNSSNEGCYFNEITGGYVNICNCGSDDCNRSFDTAAGGL